ncbi:synaptic vesicle 2-related protein-like [Diadema antillarum]|uniref:synaptic vesicle 2-related protein-like n=1 Tax=Diadema antillarum TaxID=105358 RepID=UPI003A872A0A
MDIKSTATPTAMTEELPLLTGPSANNFHPVLVNAQSAESSTPKKDVYTIDNAIDSIGMGCPQFVILFCMYVGMLSVYAQVLLKTTISHQLDCDLRLIDSQTAWVSTVFFLGEIAGSCPVGWLIDVYGRRSILILLTANLVYFGLLLSFVPSSYPWVLTLRFLAGFYSCGVQSTIVCYTGEMAPSKYRTHFMMGLLFSAGCGALYIATTGFLVVPSLGWRWQAACAGIPAFLVLATAWLIPNSPRYYALRGWTEKARELLETLARRNSRPLPSGQLVGYRRLESSVNLVRLVKKNLIRQSVIVWIIGFTAYFSYYGIALATNHIVELYANAQPQPDDEGNSTIATASYKPNDGYLCEYGLSSPCNMPVALDEYLQTLIASIGDLFGTNGGNSSLFKRTNPTGFILVIRCLTLGTYGILFLYAVEAYPTYTRASAVVTCQLFAKLAGALTPVTWWIIQPKASLCMLDCVSSVPCLAFYYQSIQRENS